MNLTGLGTMTTLLGVSRAIGRSMLDLQVKMAKAVGDDIVMEAKQMLGDYQRTDMGGYPSWDELADSTKRIRVAEGYTANDPLLRSKAGWESISRSNPVQTTPDVIEFIVGYAEDADPWGALHMRWHDHGTSKMPARPVMGPAVFRVIGQSAGIFSDIAYQHFTSLKYGQRGPGAAGLGMGSNQQPISIFGVNVPSAPAGPSGGRYTGRP